MHTFTHIYTHIYTYTHIHTCTCTCTCTVVNWGPGIWEMHGRVHPNWFHATDLFVHEPFIIRLPYDHLYSFRSQLFGYKNFRNCKHLHIHPQPHPQHTSLSISFLTCVLLYFLSWTISAPSPFLLFSCSSARCRLSFNSYSSTCQLPQTSKALREGREGEREGGGRREREEGERELEN